MSKAFEISISNRLKALHNTQGSIEKTSRALLKNRHLAKDIVKLWFKEFRNAADKQKLAFLHLANDIIQNGLESAPQFARLFEPVLASAFRETSRLPSHAVRSAVAHLLIVWADRQVYPRPFLRQLRSICQRAASQADCSASTLDNSGQTVGESPFNFSFTSALINASAFTCQTRQGQANPGRVMESSDFSPVMPDGSFYGGIGGAGDFTPESVSNLSDLHGNNLSAFREELQRELQSEAMKPPDTAELVRQLEALKSAPSGDVATRQAISEFPSDVSDFKSNSSLMGDKNYVESLVHRIKDALAVLDEYNYKLDDELAQRTQLGLSLRAYRSTLQDSMHQTRAFIEDIQSKREHAGALQKALEVHILSLPDISLRPDQTSRLDPLPSAGDLFR